ncbi:MAG: class E sortase [Acidimicrobiales bacterium]
MLTKVLGVVGRILVAAGLLLLAFTAYQLWGTGLVEAHDQSVLRSELARSLPPGAVDRAAGLAGAPPTSTIPPAAAPPRAAPAVGRPVGVLDIPRIGLDQVIVEGVDAPQLRTGPGHYPGTPLPGQAGNAAVAGHRTTYAHPFYDLNELGPGDQIVITTPQGIFVYADRQSLVVAPTDVGVLDPTATPQLTLTTCNPRYSAATRLVVHAVLVRSLLFADHGPAGPGRTAAASGAGGADGLAGASGDGSWPAAVAWGLGTVALGLAVVVVGRRARHPWVVYVPGAGLLLVALFFFFGSLTPLLPASF